MRLREVPTVILHVCNFVLIFPKQPISLPAILACPILTVPSGCHSYLLSPWINHWPLTYSVVSEHLSSLLHERMFCSGIVLILPGPTQWEVATGKHCPSKLHSQQKHTHYKTRMCFMISVTIEEIAHYGNPYPSCQQMSLSVLGLLTVCPPRQAQWFLLNITQKKKTDLPSLLIHNGGEHSNSKGFFPDPELGTNHT